MCVTRQILQFISRVLDISLISLVQMYVCPLLKSEFISQPSSPGTVDKANNNRFPCQYTFLNPWVIKLCIDEEICCYLPYVTVEYIIVESNYLLIIS